ncbi:MAG TPA: hypothetical protein VJ499_04920 [Flavisolibacter sp.]|nr:hypothetical protein [Sediminibacterium sp.]HJW16436.1 hypothetical protein [Flavisolibacter sp.]
MTNYEVTIGYRAVISINVNAENEQESKQKAIEIFEKGRGRLSGSKGINIQDDRFDADGIVNMDETWNSIY